MLGRTVVVMQEPADSTWHVSEVDWPLFRANVSLFRMTVVGESADRTPE